VPDDPAPELPFPESNPEPETSQPRPEAEQPQVQVEPQEPNSNINIPASNTDWLRDVAFKALERGISVQQVYSINVGHVVINGHGGGEPLGAITPKSFAQVLREQFVPTISTLFTGKLQGTTVRPRPPLVQAQEAGRMPVPEDSKGSAEFDPLDFGTDFAPVPLATGGGIDSGVSEAELFPTRLNRTTGT
jgi:hypothetical protein